MQKLTVSPKAAFLEMISNNNTTIQNFLSDGGAQRLPLQDLQPRLGAQARQHRPPHEAEAQDQSHRVLCAVRVRPVTQQIHCSIVRNSKPM